MSCKYPYHQKEHEDLCVFEMTLDTYLVPDDDLTEDAILFRNKLIEGVKQMHLKVVYFEI